MLSAHCLSYLCSLSAMLVYCGQTVGLIKVPLGTEIGLFPRHIVLDVGPSSPKGAQQSPNFRPMSIVAKQLDGSRCHLVRR